MTRLYSGLLPILGIFLLLLVSLYLMSDLTQTATRFGRLYVGLLALNSLLLALLTVLIGINLVAMVGQVIKREPGSRLTLRLMLMIVVLAAVPVAIVYTFSIRFLDRGIDSWFDVRVEQALDDSLALSRSSLELLMRQLRRQTEPMVQELAEVPEEIAPLVLNDLLTSSGAVELTLFGGNQRIIATSGELSASMVPQMPDENVLRLLNEGQSYVGLDPTDGLHVRLVLPVPGRQGETGNRSLQALYPMTERINTLANSVQEAYGKYQELTYLRTPLKQSFTLTLSLVLLLSVLFAVWAAFYTSRRLMAPIRELAEGTRHVAAGEFDRKLPAGRKDDLGQLAESFNQMTDRLSAARDSAELNQRLVEDQHTYLQTVLEHLSSGVLTLDEDLVLRTANATASQILALELEHYLGRELNDIGADQPALERFCTNLTTLIGAAETDWQDQIALFSTGGRKVLSCRGTRLPARTGLPGGHVIVFDDVTELLQAQRDAAWGEVARRLAHEIKNPLTPIQLSAERMRKKLLPALGEKDADVLERLTHTIVQQVESMKTMVNAFSEYARPPAMDVRPVNLNGLIAEITELYRSGTGETKFSLALDAETPWIDADPVRIRQVLHNLIKNALEAFGEEHDGRIEIITRGAEEAGGHFVELLVCDNGPGFPEDFMDRLFEPYVSSKTRGNGLGLAIVKKIVEEHSGMVSARNEDGATICIMLPATSAELPEHDKHNKNDNINEPRGTAA